MDPKPRSPAILLAPPPSGSSGAVRLPAAREPPPVDERLVQPETREQLVRGRRVVAVPANPEHGDPHATLNYIIGAHIKEGYVGSTDLLTRCAESSDFAFDTSVRRDGIDPTTGTRYLEELAFELVDEQSLQDLTEQAEDLSARGVRRVVAIFVQKGEVCEWSATTGAWETLDPDGTFEDPTLVRPLGVRELVDPNEADNAVARALLAKNNPVILEMIAESRRQGRKKGLRTVIDAACELLGIELTAARQARMNELDAPELEALLDQLYAERRWPAP